MVAPRYMGGTVPQLPVREPLPSRVQGAGMLGLEARATAEGVALLWEPAGGFEFFGTQRRPSPGAGIAWQWLHRYLGQQSEDLDRSAAAGETYEYRVIGRRSRRGPDVLRSAAVTVTAGVSDGVSGGTVDPRLPDIQPPEPGLEPPTTGTVQEPEIVPVLPPERPAPTAAAAADGAQTRNNILWIALAVAVGLFLWMRVRD